MLIYLVNRLRQKDVGFEVRLNSWRDHSEFKANLGIYNEPMLNN